MRLRSALPPLVLFLIAIAMRWPHLATIPAPTDETDELLAALAILRAGARPLTANEPYLGPLPIYLTAAAFALFGPSLAAARAVAVLLGALIAPGTWALGRAMGGRWSAVAAGLAAACAFGPVVLSHVAWGHGAAPAFTALALAGLLAATSHPTPVRLAGTGLAAGLAVAAHPTVLALLVGAGVWWLWADRRPRRARLRSLAWVVGGFAIGYAPNLLFMARHGLAPFAARMDEHDYVGLRLAAWLPGVVQWLDGLARNLMGPAQAAVGDPRPWLAGALLLAGAILAARRRQSLPLVVVAAGALLMPLMVAGEKYTSLTGLRYPAPALPIALVATAVMVEQWTAGARARRWLAAAGVVAVVTIQVLALGGFYGETTARGVTGAPVLAAAEGLAATRSAGHEVFVDDALDTKLGGGGEVGRAVRVLLELAAVDHTVAKADKIRWFLLNGHGTTFELLLAGDTAAALGAEFPLEPVQVTPVVASQVSRSGASWGWWRYTPAP